MPEERELPSAPSYTKTQSEPNDVGLFPQVNLVTKLYCLNLIECHPSRVDPLLLNLASAGTVWSA